MTEPKILHLIDSGSTQACPTTLALLATGLNEKAARSNVLLLGGQQLSNAADNCHLEGAPRLGVPFEKPLLGLGALHRKLKDFKQVAIFHCWSIGALLAVALLRPKAMKLLSVVSPPLPDQVKKLKKMILRQPRRIRITTINSAQRRNLIAQGIPENIIFTLPPGLSDSGHGPVSKNQARQKINLDSDLPLVALLSDPPQAGDGRLAALVTGLASESRLTDQKKDSENNGNRPSNAPSKTYLRLLITPSQYRLGQAHKMLKPLGKEQLLIQSSELAYPWQILPACDAAIYMGSPGGSLSLYWAMLLGVPVAAAIEKTEQSHEDSFLIDGQNCLLSYGQSALSYSIARLLDDRDLNQHISRTASDTASEHFDSQTYSASLGAIYNKLMGPTWLTTNEPAPDQCDHSHEAIA